MLCKISIQIQVLLKENAEGDTLMPVSMLTCINYLVLINLAL